MKDNFNQLFDELSQIGINDKDTQGGPLSMPSDSFDLIDDKNFAIEVERTTSVKTEGIQTYRRECITFRITK